jgi:hypothetical protein
MVQTSFGINFINLPIKYVLCLFHSQNIDLSQFKEIDHQKPRKNGGLVQNLTALSGGRSQILTA